MILRLLFLLACLCAPLTAAPLVLAGALDPMASRVSILTLDHRYDEALRLSTAPSGMEKEAAYAIMKAIVLIARYDDLGRDADLNSASQSLNQALGLVTLQPNAEIKAFWTGLAKIEQGYILNAQGHEIRGASVSREGSLILAGLKNSDAQGFGAIYRFYKDQMLGKLNPWSSPPVGERDQVASAMNSSRYFASLFANALGWMDFDLKRYGSTAKTAFAIVGAHPNNRIFRQMAGDALRRSQNYAAAKTWYSISVEQYRSVAPGSLRHVCALANMRLISKALGDASALNSYTAEYNKYIAKVRSKMPPSLVKELDKNDLWD